MAKYQTITSDKSKKKAMKYCLIGGWFGMHHYYVGNIGRGLLYTFTFGLFLLGILVDLVKLSTGTFRDGSGAPLRE